MGGPIILRRLAALGCASEDSKYRVYGKGMVQTPSSQCTTICTPATKRTGRNALFSAGIRMENGALGKIRIPERVLRFSLALMYLGHSCVTLGGLSGYIQET